MTDPIDMHAIHDAAERLRWGQADPNDHKLLAAFAARVLAMPPDVREAVESFAEPAAMSRDAVARKAIEALMVTKWFVGVMKGGKS